MMDDLKNIDQLFRDELYEYAPPPPAGGWERLEKELSKSRQLPLVPVWMKIAASIFFVAGSATLGWIILNKSDNTEQEYVAQTRENTVENTPVVNPSESNSTSSTYIANTREEKTTRASASEFEKDESTPANNKDIQETPVQTESPEMMLAQEQEVEIAPEKVRPGTEGELQEITPTTETITDPLASEVQDQNVPAITNPTNSLLANDQIIKQNLKELEAGQKTKSKATWSVGGLAGPQYTYRDVNVNTISYPIDDYNNYESGVTTYAGGFQVEVEPAHRFSIQSGVYYSKIGQIKTSIETDQVYASIDEPWIYGYETQPSREHNALPSDLVNSTGKITFDKSPPPTVAASDPDMEWVPGNFTAEQYFEFIEVPIVLRYRLIDKKLDMDISSGIWANFLIGNTAIATDNATFEAKGETQDINTLNYCGSLSLGFAYPLGPHIALSLEPFVKYYLKPINTNPQTDVYPYSMGIMSGIKYSF